MKVVFRVDSSSEIGIGNIMRCLSLADKLKQQNHEVVFVCRALPGNINLLINHAVLALPTDNKFISDDLYLNLLGSTQEKDAEQTITVIPSNVDLLIIDNYAINEVWHKKLRPYTKRIMVIDDLADRKFDCDILLNQNLGCQKEEYKNKVPSKCKLLIGCDYALLRPEFYKLREKSLDKRKNTKEINNILVSMGGSDVNNITYDILKELHNKLNIVVVLGEASPHNKMIKKYIESNNIELVINTRNISELMFKADLAIGAGGSTSWERCCLGLPTMMYVLAENQNKIAKNLEEIGAIVIVQDLKSDLQKILNDFCLWEEMSRKAISVCDGMGIERVFQEI
jgi:UDP-2,4-diacetamido-2,4,6-trideoxy-beta-L-altropyranose hydrolase